MQNNKEKLNLTLSPQVKAAMRQYAKQDGRSISEITNQLYQDVLQGRQPVDSVVTVQYLKFYRDFGISSFGVRVCGSMAAAQSLIEHEYHVEELDSDLVDAIKDDHGNWLDLRIGYEEDPETLKLMVIVSKQMVINEVAGKDGK